MTFSEFVAMKREEQCLSQRQFAIKAGLSNGLIAMIERGENPSTHKPITPTMGTVYAIAKAVGITLDELFATVEDFPIKMKNVKQSVPAELTDEETRLLTYYRSMNRAGRTVLMASAEGFAASSIYQSNNTGDDTIGAKPAL